MKKFNLLFLICACGPMEPIETTSILTTSSSSEETIGNSTSTSGTSENSESSTSSTVPTEASTSTTDSSSGEFCTIDRSDCPLKKDFEPCIESLECEGGICITNETRGSFCTSSCNRIGIDCEIGECFGENFCIISCEDDKLCPENMFCGVFFEKMVCFNNK